MGTHVGARERLRWYIRHVRDELQRLVEPHGGVRLPDGNAVRWSELVESRPEALEYLLERFWAGCGAELVDSLFRAKQNRISRGIRLVAPAGAKLPGNRRQLYGSCHFDYVRPPHCLRAELSQPAPGPRKL